MAAKPLDGACEGKVALGSERQQTALLGDPPCLLQIMHRRLGGERELEAYVAPAL